MRDEATRCTVALDLAGTASNYQLLVKNPQCLRDVGHPGLHLVAEVDGSALNFTDDFAADNGSSEERHA